MREVPNDDSPEAWYALTLTATADGAIRHEWQSAFIGHTETRPRRDMRRPSLVRPARMASIWSDLGMPCVVVRDRRDLFVYLHFGGTALVARSVAERFLGGLLAPMEIGFAGPLEPPTSIDGATPEATQHAPTRKLRAAILKRDDYRCLMCGRRPAENTDVKLHVHHVVQWSLGGLTVRKNLITLCETCHDGLEPHTEWKLFELLTATEPVASPDLAAEMRAYQDGVARYRDVAQGAARKVTKANARRS